MSYTLAIDQSTSGTKAIVFTAEGKPIGRADVAHRQIVNDRGWVEHDAEEIIRNVYTAVRDCLDSCHIDAHKIEAIGLSNQRETVVCWDRDTGCPVYHAIVWQCGRAAEIARRTADKSEIIRRKSGLNHSPFFSAPKITWIIENVAGAKRLLDTGRLCCGTVDSWLLYHLTQEHVFKTDCSNASRTELMNLDTLKWDEELVKLFSLTTEALPEIEMSDSVFGYTDLGGILPQKTPIACMMGDSHAALFANGCHEKGMAKATFGTGTSVMMNEGGARCGRIPAGLVECVSWGTKDGIQYALEGNINYSGAIISWLRDNLGLIENSRESGEIAAGIADTGGVYFVPAFSGMGAPYWDNDARAMICGISPATQKSHIVRAAEEAIGFQICDIARQLENDGFPITELCVDGGATRDGFLMQFVADILDIPLAVSQTEELSAAGVAYMAAISTGAATMHEIFDRNTHKRLQPRMEREQRMQLYRGWKRAVSMVMNRGENNI